MTNTAPNFNSLDDAAVELGYSTDLGRNVNAVIAECHDNNPEPDDNEGRIGTLVCMLSDRHREQDVRDWFTARGVRY